MKFRFADREKMAQMHLLFEHFLNPFASLYLSISLRLTQNTLPSSDHFNSPLKLFVLYKRTIYLYFPTSCVHCFIPNNLRFDIVKPVSSKTSIIIESTKDSFGFI